MHKPVAERGVPAGSPPDGRKPTVVAVANRLPVRHGDDGWELSPGGLVTALRPVMATHSGAWVGWDGGTGSKTSPRQPF
jgi:trehalose 6-phosphate synthase